VPLFVAQAFLPVCFCSIFGDCGTRLCAAAQCGDAVQLLVQGQALAQHAPLFQRMIQKGGGQFVGGRLRAGQPVLGINQLVIGGYVLQQQFGAARAFGLRSCGHEPIMR
jgi:hypothetical protein